MGMPCPDNIPFHTFSDFNGFARVSLRRAGPDSLLSDGCDLS